ncbi:MAG: DUF432 domain-containing protein [Verrucomicrobiota bacterium]
MSSSPRWHERKLLDGEWLRADFGKISIVVHSILEEWRVAVVEGSDRDQLPAAEGPPPEDLDWHRWDRGADDVKLRFRPVFPDHPIILRPRAPFHLSPRALARFYVGIPAFIELSAHSEGEYTTLKSWPTQRLSNTWHGSPLEGILCYAARTRARREIVTDEWEAYDIACSIEISNQSSDTLDFERLFFDTDHLGIFEQGEQLWANHARIRVSDKETDLNRVVFASTPIGEAEKAVQLSAPRLGSARRSVFKKAFSTVISTFQDD